MLKRILLGVAGTPATANMTGYAVDLARRNDAAVQVMSIVNMSAPKPAAGLGSFGGAPSGGAKLREAAKQGIGEVVTACQAANVPVKVIEQEPGGAIETLVNQWRYADLVMLGLRSWFDRKVVEKPEDVLLDIIVKGVRPILSVPEEVHPVQEVLIVYDGSTESAFAMKRFIHMNMWPSVKLFLGILHADKAKAAILQDEAADYCRAFGLNPQCRIFEGDPKQAIEDYAAEVEADIITIGSGYNDALFRHSFASNTLHLIQKTSFPVFMSH